MADMEKIADRITNWLKEKVEGAGAKGLVVGLSGGVDSACVAALSKRACGDDVLGVLMPCHSNPEDAEMARMTADALDVKTATVDLTAAFDALMAALPPDLPELPTSDMARANVKPRLRMTALYYFSGLYGYLVAGTGNKSEDMIGYFTKYGDGGVDLLPIADLYKWQVWELAKVLGVPQPVIDRPPTAGLWHGQTDEDELGLTYKLLDETLAAIEAGTPEKAEPEALKKVQKLMRAAQHKLEYPPVLKLDS